MKHLCVLFAFLTVLLSCSPPKPVEMPDANLTTAVREALDLAPNAPIMERNLKTLRLLSVRAKGVTNLL